MENHSWKPNISSAIERIPRNLWNLEVHYLLYNSLSLIPIPSYINPVQAILSYFFKGG